MSAARLGLVALSLAAILTACGGPVSGVVVDKKFEDAGMIMLPVTTCSKTCTTTLVPTFTPARYLLVVETAAGETEKAEVDPFTWEAAAVGDEFDESSTP